MADVLALHCIQDTLIWLSGEFLGINDTPNIPTDILPTLSKGDLQVQIYY